MRIAVTGSSGKLGRPAAELLRRQGHDVLGVDQEGEPGFGFTKVNLTDYGQALDTMLGVTARLTGVDVLVHLAAIPVNGLVPDAALFHNNLSVTFNVMHAALRARIRTIVCASSITAVGFPFTEPPAYLPLDEDCPLRANNTYGLAKVAEETIAAQLVRWEPELSITALRFTNVTREGEYRGFAARHADPDYRRDLLWSYVDARDGAAAISLAVEQAAPGFRAYNITASDTGLSIPSRELASGAFPGVPLREIGEFETLMSIERARTELGFEPKHLWRDELAAQRSALSRFRPRAVKHGTHRGAQHDRQVDRGDEAGVLAEHFEALPVRDVRRGSRVVRGPHHPTRAPGLVERPDDLEPACERVAPGRGAAVVVTGDLHDQVVLPGSLPDNVETGGYAVRMQHDEPEMVEQHGRLRE